MQRSTASAIVPSLLAVVLISACADRSPSPTAPASPGDRSASVAAADAGGGVYTMTNAASGNAVLAFRRAADGSLTSLGAFATGGRGTGGSVDPLQSQYSLLLDDAHSELFAVNAGSSDVTAFRVLAGATLQLVNRVPSGGIRPVSLATSGRLLYVLNAGDNTVTGFRIDETGELLPIPHSTRSLAAGAAGASTVHFAVGGRWLVVTERDANRLETFAVGSNGRLGAPVVTASSGAVPFGFDVTAGGLPIVSEAGGAAPDGAVSSYRIAAGGSLGVITGSLDAGGVAACWLILTPDDAHAFVVNSGSNAIAAVGVASDGTLTLVNAFAGTTGTGTAPLDPDLAGGGRYLYVLEGAAGKIGAFAVGAGGTLTPLAVTPVGTGSSGMQGMAAF